MSWQGFVPGPQGDRKSKGKKGGVASKIAAFQQQSRNFGNGSGNGQAQSQSNGFNAQKKKSWNTHNNKTNFQAPAPQPAPAPAPPKASWSKPAWENAQKNRQNQANTPMNYWSSNNNNNNNQNSWNNQYKPAPVTAPSWNNNQNQPQNQNSWNNQNQPQNQNPNQAQNSWNNQNQGWNGKQDPVIKPPYDRDYGSPKRVFNFNPFKGISLKTLGIGFGVFLVLVLVIVVAAAASGGGDEGELQVVRFPAETRRGKNNIGLLVLSNLDEDAEFAFINAADTWSKITAGTPFAGRTFRANENVCDGNVFGRETTIDHIAIFAAVDGIDGRGGTLAQAGPCRRDVNNFFPVIGNMLFDEADIGSLVNAGTLVGVILHEMGHVLGIGTGSGFSGLLVDRVFNGNQINVGNQPKFLGINARTEMAVLAGKRRNNPEPFVPVEDGFQNGQQGRFDIAAGEGRGSIDGHWDQDTFFKELMEFQSSANPKLSTVTVGGLKDLGYTVTFRFCDAYTLGRANNRREKQSDEQVFTLANDLLEYDEDGYLIEQ